jgi:hypothetical protein
MIINGQKIKPRANLQGANLKGADLKGANLKGADLPEANMRWANLQGANLRMATYSVMQVFDADWCELSDELTLELMRLDASAIPNGEALMGKWADGGECPLDASGKDRVVRFREKQEIWTPGPSKPLWTLWEMIAEECGVWI